MKSRFNWKEGLIFGTVMMVFFILKDLLTHDELTVKSVVIFVASGLIGGAIAGFLFGWLFRFFRNSAMVQADTAIDISPDEEIIFETGGNHFKGIEAVGGKLYLTTNRLVFSSHRFNIQRHQLSVPLNDIEKIDRYKTVGLVNNGLAVTTSDGKTERFVVEQPEVWPEKILETVGLK